MKERAKRIEIREKKDKREKKVQKAIVKSNPPKKEEYIKKDPVKPKVETDYKQLLVDLEKKPSKEKVYEEPKREEKEIEVYDEKVVVVHLKPENEKIEPRLSTKQEIRFEVEEKENVVINKPEEKEIAVINKPEEKEIVVINKPEENEQNYFKPPQPTKTQFNESTRITTNEPKGRPSLKNRPRPKIKYKKDNDYLEENKLRMENTENYRGFY